MENAFRKLAWAAVMVAFCVIVLGAWVRLSHAGLGCPDWPGCYGQLTWPAAHQVADANQAFPERPFEADKAWREMLHRYLAGSLVLLVAALNLLAWRWRNAPAWLRGGCGLAFVLILFQAALGMWTVTLKLLPLVVMGHLLGGMSMLLLLVWLAFLAGKNKGPGLSRPGLAWFALSVLALQIALGGWTSANYAALACPDLPTCAGAWWPDPDFREGFTLWREIGVDYEGGILDQSARAAIHLAHRIGALVTLAVLLFAGWRYHKLPDARRPALCLLVLVLVQFGLGLLNVALKLPLANAVAHNAVAALLLANLCWLLNTRSQPRP